MSLEFIQQPATQKLKEIPLGSLELRAVSNQVTVCELTPTNSFVRIKTCASEHQECCQMRLTIDNMDLLKAMVNFMCQLNRAKGFPDSC